MTAANGESSGRASLGSFVPAFERVVGRTPTVEEKKEALALADVVKTSGMDPILLFYLAFRRELAEMHALVAETRERVPGEKRLGAAVEAVTEAVHLLRAEPRTKAAPVTLAPESLAAIEAAVTRAIKAPEEEVPPSRVIVWLRERWPAVAAALARCTKAARSVIEARWPIAMMWTALALALIAGISVTAASVQRGRDVAISQSFSTSAGVAAMKLAAANPNLAHELTSCTISGDGAHHVMDCRLWPIGSTALYRRGASWYSMPLGIVFDWVSSWPVQWVTVGLVFPWVIIAALGFAKRGPATRRRRLV